MSTDPVDVVVSSFLMIALVGIGIGILFQDAVIASAVVDFAVALLPPALVAAVVVGFAIQIIQ